MQLILLSRERAQIYLHPLQKSFISVADIKASYACYFQRIGFEGRGIYYRVYLADIYFVRH